MGVRSSDHQLVTGKQYFKDDFQSAYVEQVDRVQQTSAFATNGYTQTTWTQPANTLITGITILCTEAPTVVANANSDLGFKVGTTDGGVELVADDKNGLIDAAGNTTALKAGGHVALTLVGGATALAQTAVPADVQYTTAERTVYLNTYGTATAAAAGTGTIEWIIRYIATSNT